MIQSQENCLYGQSPFYLRAMGRGFGCVFYTGRLFGMKEEASLGWYHHHRRLLFICLLRQSRTEAAKM